MESSRIDIRDLFVKDLHKPYERSWVIYTGQDGMNKVNWEMQRENDRDYTKFLCDKHVITSEQRDSILKMIDSPDTENYTIAQIFLEKQTTELHKITKDGTNISSKKS